MSNVKHINLFGKTIDIPVPLTSEQATQMQQDIAELKASAGESSLAQTIERYYRMKRTGKIYRTRVYLYDTNPTVDGTKLLDNTGLVAKPSTDTVLGQDDYLNGQHPMFEWVNVNYKRNADGSPYPTAIEGDADFKTDGDADVGVMQMSFYYGITVNTADGYVDFDVSDMQHVLRTDVNLKPWTECVKADKTVLPWCIASKYPAVRGSDGLLHSQPGKAPAYNMSHNGMITEFQKKGAGHWGAGCERNTFQIIFNAIKYATKSSQKYFAGCTNYNFNYPASIKRDTAETYFPLTKTQAANVEIGSCVSVGYGTVASGAVNTTERGYGNLHKYADRVRVLKKEAIDDNNVAIYLDTSKGFTTTDVSIDATNTSAVILTSMPCFSGITDAVLGHYDGSPVSNTNSHFTYRLQGREYLWGQYCVASDTVMEFQSDYSRIVYTAPKGVKHSSSEATIRSTYKKVGTITPFGGTDNNDTPIGDVMIDTDTGAWFPYSKASGTSVGVGDYIYAGGKATSGFREYLQSGSLWSGANAGACCLNCWAGLSGAYWHYGACD